MDELSAQIEKFGSGTVEGEPRDTLMMFAEFEHEILRERIRAGIAGAQLRGKHLGRPLTVAKMAGQIRRLYRAGIRPRRRVINWPS